MAATGDLSNPAPKPTLADTPHQPGTIPTATLLPVWNTVALFKVQPGRSFHSIQVGITKACTWLQMLAVCFGRLQVSAACLRLLRVCPRVQEVFTSDKPRMSIQGWYHCAQAPEHAELATRSQLQLRAGEDTVHEFAPFAGGCEAESCVSRACAFCPQPRAGSRLHNQACGVTPTHRRQRRW